MDTYVKMYSRRYIKSKMVEEALCGVSFSFWYVILHIMFIFKGRGLKYKLWIHAIKQNFILIVTSTLFVPNNLVTIHDSVF